MAGFTKRSSFALRLATALTVLVTAIMLVVALVVRNGVVEQFKGQYESEVASSIRGMQSALTREHEAVVEQLSRLAAKIRTDVNFRDFVQIKRELINPFIIDYAQREGKALDIQVLEIVGPDSSVLSSAHDRNAFGKDVSGLIQTLAASGTRATAAAFEKSGEPFTCLAAVVSLQLGAQQLFLIGGKKIDAAFLRSILRGESQQIAVLRLPDRFLSSSGSADGAVEASLQAASADYSRGEFTLPFAEGNKVEQATVFLLHPKTELLQLLSAVNQRIAVVTLVGIILSVFLSLILSRSIARPLAKLSAAAQSLSLDKLDAAFDVQSRDEVGVLNDALAAMLRRLKLDRLQLASAEKKAAFGEIARQVNHDIKNGFIPIRNVMQHWQEVAAQSSGILTDVFNERKATILDSLSYMEDLARRYSRLRPEVRLTKVEIKRCLQSLIENYRDLPGRDIRIKTELGGPVCHVHADEIQMRRAFENILQNALEATSGDGLITIACSEQEGEIKITFTDTGCGMADDVQGSLFQAHVTTKPNGTGLGLVNVKRIIEEAGGSVAVTSAAGKGTTFEISLPKIECEKDKASNPSQQGRL